MSGPRDVAARVLARVWKEDAYAAAALDAEIARAGLDGRDAALATELVLGVLRTEPTLERVLRERAGKGKLDVKGEARAALFCAAYAIAYLRTPPFAAVSEAVRIAKEARGERVGGFVNALLRKLEGKRDLAEDTLASLPGWLHERLARELGEEGLRALVAPGAPLGLVVPPGEDRDAWIEKLRAELPGATFEAGRVSPRAILATNAGRLRRLPIQEEGAQVVALALAAREGESILDACAGRGNKTALLAQAAGARGRVVATDLSTSKLERAARPGVEARAHDWTLPATFGPFDAALVDAPCTGTGTLRRRPEIARRRTPEDVPRLAELQRAILQNVAACVRPGGRVVYAVCSVLPEEGRAVVEAVDSLELQPFDGTGIPALEGKTTVLLTPHEHATDGYFLASLRRRS